MTLHEEDWHLSGISGCAACLAYQVVSASVSVLQYVAVRCSVPQWHIRLYQHQCPTYQVVQHQCRLQKNGRGKGVGRCSVLQCVAVCYSVLHCDAVCCIVLQCVALCCSVLQCVAVCCSARCSVSVRRYQSAGSSGCAPSKLFCYTKGGVGRGCEMSRRRIASVG